ncbi:MAG: hypothetical protein GF307_03465 [candidate division Zixibacteria bacterium]|nr:hypothetical protein [candidate division Zixibacteria bacterium]
MDDYCGALAQWNTTDDFSNANPLPRQPVEFYREKIIMRIDEDYVHITGIYYFRNNKSQKIRFPLVYPFPIDETHTEPDSIIMRFRNGGNENDIDFRESPRGKSIACRLPLMPGDDNVMTVIYRQKLKGNEARYILTTTAAWGKPFELAEYEIFIPDDFEDVDINYPFTIDNKDEALKKFTYKRSNFMPDRDLVVKWH